MISGIRSAPFVSHGTAVLHLGVAKSFRRQRQARGSDDTGRGGGGGGGQEEKRLSQRGGHTQEWEEAFGGQRTGSITLMITTQCEVMELL